MKLLINDGSGNFSFDNSRLPSDALDKRALVTRFFDANGDGKPDLFLGWEESPGSITDLLLLNDGTGRFSNMVSGALPARLGGTACGTVNAGAGDVNGDGRLDIILSTFCDLYASGGHQVLINRGDGTFSDDTAQWLPDGFIVPSPVYADYFYWPRTIQFADFNGDGRQDVVVQALDGRHNLYMNSGTRLVAASEFLAPMDELGGDTGGGGDVAVGDFNHDGRPDIVMIDHSITPIDTFYVGLGKATNVKAPAPVSKPEILQMNVLNEASLGANELAPGTRVRIRVNGFGPTVPVVFQEGPTVTPPTILAGVRVTFDSVAAQLLAVSSSEITAIVPFAMTGKWIASVQVAYGGAVSQPTAVPITATNAQIYGVHATDGRLIANTWRIVNGVRTPVTGSLTWGDRFAFRVTGAGQGTPPISDGSGLTERPFVPASSFRVGVRDGITKQDLNIVSMTYAPEGLTGIVEITVDLPPVRPPGINGGEFYVYDKFESAYNVWWPITGTTAAGAACTFAVSPSTLSFAGAGGNQTLAVTTAAGCSWSGVLGQEWESFPAGAYGTGNGTITVAASANNSAGARSGSITLAGRQITISQAALPPPVITSIKTVGGSTNLVQNGWTEIHVTDLGLQGVGAGGLLWNNAPEFATGQMPAQLGGVSVTINGKPAFLYYVSPDQVNVLAPLDAALGPVNVVVSVGARSSAPFAVQKVQVSPGFPTVGGTHIVSTHADASLIGPTSFSVPGYPFSPAKPGETIVIYGFGFGLPTAALVNGSAAQFGQLATMPTIQFGGLNATVIFAGVVSPGLYQFNVVVPVEAANGDNAVTVSYAGVNAVSGLKIAVQR